MTSAQFKAIKRNEDGDIIWLDEVIGLLNDDQIEKLSDDDWSRYFEEMNQDYF